MEELLRVRPDLYAEEIQWFLWDEYDIWVHESTVKRMLRSKKYTKKRLRIVAAQRNQYLRDDWIRRLSKFKHYQLVFIDESAANETTKERKHGWALPGVRPTISRPFKRSERWSILPAYTSRRGYITYEIVQGSYTSESYLAFIRDRVLPLCNPYDPEIPRENSILVMDNASIHRGPELRTLCDLFQVTLEFLPPYSPDYNPIEESFAELKAWMKRNQVLADCFPPEEFGQSLHLAVQHLMGRQGTHFASCCISLED